MFAKVDLYVKWLEKYGMPLEVLKIYLYKYYFTEVTGIGLAYSELHTTMLFS